MDSSRSRVERGLRGGASNSRNSCGSVRKPASVQRHRCDESCRAARGFGAACATARRGCVPGGSRRCGRCPAGDRRPPGPRGSPRSRPGRRARPGPPARPVRCARAARARRGRRPVGPRRPVTPIEQRSRVGDGRSGTEGRQRVQQLDTRQWECRDRLGDRCRAHQSRGQVVQTAQGRPPVGIRPVMQDLGQSVGRAIGQPRGSGRGHRSQGHSTRCRWWPRCSVVSGRCLLLARLAFAAALHSDDQQDEQSEPAAIDVTKKMPDKAFDTSMPPAPGEPGEGRGLAVLGVAEIDDEEAEAEQRDPDTDKCPELRTGQPPGRPSAAAASSRARWSRSGQRQAPG